ncbi:MAG: hypothetical protein Q7T82_19505 [Armatimonadota bacterium]|nr:hypothetical protein [Armatimonadota bacterium]
MRQLRWAWLCAFSVALCVASEVSAEAVYRFRYLRMPPGIEGFAVTAANDRGQMVGEGWRNRDACLLFWESVDATAEVVPLPAIDSIRIRHMNNRGQVVGATFIGGGTTRAFMWSRESGYMELGLPEGADSSFAHGINDSGQVVGMATWWDPGIWPEQVSQATDYGTGAFPIPIRPSIIRPWRWSAEAGMSVLGPQDMLEGWAMDINDRGEIAGFFTPNESPTVRHAATWTFDGELTVLSTPPGVLPRAMAYSIGKLGQVAGACYDDRGHAGAVFWDRDGVPLQIGPFPGTAARPCDMNDKGEVIGSWENTESEYSFLWDRRRGATTLLLPDGAPGTAYTINDFGLIGGSNHGGWQPCVWIPCSR